MYIRTILMMMYNGLAQHRLSSSGLWQAYLSRCIPPPHPVQAFKEVIDAGS